MSSKLKEIDCITRLFKLTDCYSELVDFLIEEKIVTDGVLANLKLELNKPRFLHDILKQAEKDDKLLLLSFDWVLLPVERMRMRLITERSNKEFAYRY